MIDATKSRKWWEEKRGANLNKWFQMADYNRDTSLKVMPYFLVSLLGKALR